jgi:predicted ferric reductase
MNQTSKRFVGTIIVLLPVLLLVIMWVTMAPLSSRFIDLQTILLSLGRISGLIGLALYSIGLMLHVRIAFFRWLGLDGAYTVKLHHDFGSWALVLLLIHP